MCEPLARLKSNITGVDADSNAIQVANEHAKEANLNVTYLNQDIETLDTQYDVVLALEIIEHVSDIGLFMQQCTKLVKPGGLLIMSTLNRTPKSYLLGIIAAENILGWVPKGTHSWRKFVKPSEIASHARKNGFITNEIKGLIYNPLKNNFTLSDSDLDVNYLIALRCQR